MLPELTTERLVLSPATDSDLERLWRLLTEPEVRRFLCDDTILSREQVAEMMAESRVLAGDGLGLWTIATQAGEWVGCVGLHPVAVAAAFEAGLTGEVEPVVALVPALWGHGYATEALTAVIAYGFGPRGLRQLMAVVDKPNLASHRLVTRVGFIPVGESAGPKYRLVSYRLAAVA